MDSKLVRCVLVSCVLGLCAAALQRAVLRWAWARSRMHLHHVTTTSLLRLVGGKFVPFSVGQVDAVILVWLSQLLRGGPDFEPPCRTRRGSRRRLRQLPSLGRDPGVLARLAYAFGYAQSAFCPLDGDSPLGQSPMR